MTLKKVYQHSVFLKDVGFSPVNISREKIWEALEKVYFNRHQYLDFFMDSRILTSTEKDGKKIIELEVDLPGQKGVQKILERHELDAPNSVETTIDATQTGKESRLVIELIEGAGEGPGFKFTYSQGNENEESDFEGTPEGEKYKTLLYKAWRWKDTEICAAVGKLLSGNELISQPEEIKPICPETIQ